MQAIKAYYDEGKFVPFKPVDIPNGRHVIVTILDSDEEFQFYYDGESIPAETRLELLESLEGVAELVVNEDIKMRKEWLNSLKQARSLAKDDSLIDFPIRQPMRGPHGVTD